MDKQNWEIFLGLRNLHVGTLRYRYPDEFNMHHHALTAVEQQSQNKGARLPDPYQSTLIKHTSTLLEVFNAFFILGPPASFHDSVQSQTWAHRAERETEEEVGAIYERTERSNGEKAINYTRSD